MIRKMKSFWISLDDTTIISKRELFLEIVSVALAGLVLGMIFTPKKTVTIGSNNGGKSYNCGNNGCDGCEDCDGEDEE